MHTKSFTVGQRVELFTSRLWTTLYRHRMATLRVSLVAAGTLAIAFAACATSALPETSSTGNPVNPNPAPDVSTPNPSSPSTPEVAPPTTPATPEAAQGSKQDIFALNKLLARSVNFGNALEAPNEGDWGMRLEERFFDLLKKAGFTGIRLPVKFSAHTAPTAPYTLDAKFMERVDWAIKNATSRGMAIIVDMHHYDELMKDPAAHRERFLGMWSQIATRYQKQPANVFFEIHNEPNDKIEPLWNEYSSAALAVIRKTNPTRAVIIGPNGWNNADRFVDLKLPNDPNLIATFHNYVPFDFTHQGAEWAGNSPTGIPWPQTGVRLGGGWQSWSWDTRVTAKPAGLEVQYQKGWAGFYAHSEAKNDGFEKLRLKTNRAMKLKVKCFSQSEGDPPGVDVETQAGVALEVPLAGCGFKGTLRDIFLMNNTPDAQAPYLLQTLELVGAGKTASLFSDSYTDVRSYLDRAANWGKANNRPIFMGEFGAYSKGDYASRVRWTKFTREETEKRGISWAYWEFGAGFGVFDRTKNAWNLELLQGLIPGAKP